MKSIIKYGFSFPIFVWKKNILDGHQRLAAVKKLIDEGHEIVGGKLPVVKIQARTKKEAAEKLLLINSRYAKIDQSGFDAFIADFSIDLESISDLLVIPEINFDFENDQEFEGLTDPEEVPETPETPVTKTGDIWILGNHRLMCGDSTKIEDVERLMDGVKADICFTSPPYGMKEKILSKNSKNRNKSIYLEYKDDPNKLSDLFNGFIESSKGFTDVWAINFQILAKSRVFFASFLEQYKEYLIDIIVWDKHMTAPNFNKSILSSRFELIIILGNQINPLRKIPFSDWHGTLSNLIDIDSRRLAEYRKVHQATFPVELPCYILSKLFNKSESVYEPFSGTGTTIIAAQQTNRRCYAMEISPQYVDLAVKRWQDFTGEDAVLESTGQKYEKR